MDVDADDDVAASWPFEELASPSQSLLNLQFSSPPSPLWPFEDRASALFGASNPDLECSRLLAREFDWGKNTDSVEKKTNETSGPKPTKPTNPTLELDSSSSDRSYLIKEKLTQALRYFKESTNQHILVQVWAPVKNGEKCVLTTSGQPFVLDPQSIGLLQYRTVSLMYVFSVDGDDTADLGLPGRVYRQKVPEWTPNVQYYSVKEYPRLTHAVNYNVHGTVALPVFEPSSQSCVAVVELIMTSPKINYTGEVDKVCKALEAVNLRSTEILDHPTVQIRNEGRQSALVEILEILTIVCENQNLPLAQTWVPCSYRTVLAHGGGVRKHCTSLDDTCTAGDICLSASDITFHIIDACLWAFRDACIEHHLKKGQGVVGKAFASRRLCFARDIKLFGKLEYPLVHYARMFGLGGSFAVSLQSVFTGSDDYVLEFFLPKECVDEGEQREMLQSVISIMKGCFRNLKVVDGVELSLENIYMLVPENQDFELSNGVGNVLDQSLIEGNHTSGDDGNTVIIPNGEGDSTCAGSAEKSLKKTEKRRGKAEKMISLEVLQQYFAGSLKSAAKSLGVCPTTMKRICRQHGITRWPSRKINKVNRSLSKLKQVIESVQGPEGTFNFTSITGPLLIPSSTNPSPLPPNSSTKPLKNKSPKPSNSKASHSSKSKSSSEEVSINTRTSETNPLSDPTQPDPQLAGMLLEDSGSSKDLQNLCTFALESTQSSNTVTIKASYKEDIIRFRFALPGSVGILREEVAKRLKLEVGTFEIKYLDDDQEWVKLVYDADLEECMEISRGASRGKNVIVRLSVSDIGVNLGSSCESSG